MRQVQTVLTVLCLTASACGDGDELEPRQSEDAGVDAGHDASAVYTLFAVRNVEGTIRFETKVEQIGASELDTVYAALGDAGYVVTAPAADAAGVVLVSTRPVGDATRYDTRIARITDYNAISRTTQTELVPARYAVTSAVFVSGPRGAKATISAR